MNNNYKNYLKYLLENNSNVAKFLTSLKRHILFYNNSAHKNININNYKDWTKEIYTRLIF